MSSIFDIVSYKLLNNKKVFLKKNQEVITEESFKNAIFYFEETNVISSFKELERVWNQVVKTKYDRGIIYYEKIKSLDCFSLTKYFPTRYGFLNQQFIFDFKNGKNTEMYAEIFAETITDLLKNRKDLLNNTIIVPVPASTRLTNEIRFKKLFELISSKTGVQNGYDSVVIRQDRQAKHITGSYNTSLEGTVEIDFTKLRKAGRIILIDDVITKGNSISDFANKIKSSCEKKSSIFGLSLGRTVKAEEVESGNSEINKNYLDVLSLKGKNSTKINKIDVLKSA